ncbi:putative lipoprotein [Treponema primitia ZAS-2]|uniref:Putative lipoprotein n=1 Tax=Treponema primitia (strain ATCC BAA-887 / DSM 12427 / ZAS-2) TaxID=545694 RepID=F5YJ51_TREPZ|nr:ABC transporter substrate-binding protein [Treponema primitia]AEF86278.1 putative lipoprotein [Treponema primitia ZAS-2]
MKKNQLFLLLLAGIFAATLILGGCAKKEALAAGEQTIDKIRLGVMAGATLVADVGVADGIFKKHGLDVEITTFAAGINTIDAITIGQLDIGLAADFAILNRIGGTPNSPLRIFTGNASILNNSQLFSQDPSVKTPADLAGKSVLVHLGTVGEYYWAQTWTGVGVPESRIKYLPVDSPLEAVAVLQTGAAQGYYANGKTAEEVKKIEGIHVVGELHDYVPSTVGILIASEQFLREHQRAVEKYLKALDELYGIVAKDPQRAAEISYKTSGVPVEIGLQTLKTQTLAVDVNQDTFDALKAMYQWLEGKGLIKYPYDLYKTVDTTALKAAFPDRAVYK